MSALRKGMFSVADTRLAVARVLARNSRVRAMIRYAERNPRVAGWLERVADRLLGHSGNYRLAIQSDATVPTDASLEAVFALRRPVRPNAVGPVVLVVDDLGAGGAQRQLALTASGIKRGGYSDVTVLCRSSQPPSVRGNAFFRAQIESSNVRVGPGEQIVKRRRFLPLAPWFAHVQHLHHGTTDRSRHPAILS